MQFKLCMFSTNLSCMIVFGIPFYEMLKHIYNTPYGIVSHQLRLQIFLKGFMGSNLLVSALPLCLRCFGRIDSVFFDSLVTESYLDDFAFFESYRFFFVFDGFFIKFDEWTFCRFGFGGDYIFFDVCRSASSVQWAGPSMTSISILKETFFPTIFCWF